MSVTRLAPIPSASMLNEESVVDAVDDRRIAIIGHALIADVARLFAESRWIDELARGGW